MALVLSSSPTITVHPSQEEDDLLFRSSKKVKNSGKVSAGESLVQDQWPELGAHRTASVNGRLSFADKLKGVDQKSEQDEEERGEEDDIESDDCMSESSKELEYHEPLCNTTEDPSRNFPTFSFLWKMKKKLYRAWRKAVIVKLLDRGIGYKALQSRLQSMWAKKGIITLIDIGQGFYVVKLSNREDYFQALTGGPWMIYDHYLTVRPWEPNFRPEKATTSKLAVWVRIPKLSLEYYDEEALTIIGNRIGETVKVDANTSSQLRGHYARVCVLVDLRKQLMSGFVLDGENYFLEYEGLHMLCTNCGKYGHRIEMCPDRRKPTDLKEQDVNNQQSYQENGGGLNVEAGGDQMQWRVVQKKRGQRKSKENIVEENKQERRGSRFGVLAEDDIQEQNINNYENNKSEFAQEAEKETVNPMSMITGRQVRGRRRGNLKKKDTLGSTGKQRMDYDMTGEADVYHKRSEKRSRSVGLKEGRNSELLLLTIEGSTEGSMQKNEPMEVANMENRMTLGQESEKLDEEMTHDKGVNELDKKEGKLEAQIIESNVSPPYVLDLIRSNDIRIEEVDPGDFNNGLMSMGLEPIIVEVGENNEVSLVPETQFSQEN